MKNKQIFSLNGKTFFPLAGQPGTNVSFFPGELDTFFKGAKIMRLNSAEIQLYWQQINPEQGKYDFTDFDRILEQCRANNMRWLLTWFATWKNGTMKYAPQWVKKNKAVYKRVLDHRGVEQNVLSSHCEANYEADKAAFTALMEHIKKVDSDKKTVIGIQVENEPGIFAPTARDYGEEATKEYNSQVPSYIIQAIEAAGKGNEYNTWAANGKKKAGTWEEVFGRDGAEFLTTWSVAKYINGIARAGKDIYDLPMYANNWAAERFFQYPGIDYPCGGPNSKVIDLWLAVCREIKGIDMICPDNYSPNYTEFNRQCALYDREDNPLYIPETGGMTRTAWQPFAAIGFHNSIGYALMGGVGNAVDASGNLRPEYECIAASLRGVADVIPLLISQYGTGNIHGIVQEVGQANQYMDLRGYKALVTFGQGARFFRRVEKPVPEDALGGGLIIQTGDHEFYIVGYGFSVELHKACPPDQIWPDFAGSVRSQEIDYLLTEEGYFDDNGAWKTIRIRQGDTNDYGITMQNLEVRCLHVIMNP